LRGLERDGTIELDFGFVVAREHVQHQGEAVVGAGVVGAHFEIGAEMGFGVGGFLLVGFNMRQSVENGWIVGR